MASDKLRRKVRRKLGMPNPQPTQQHQITPSALQVRPVRAKGCCGKTNDLSLTSGTFYITNHVRLEMISHCKRELPYEACGLLSGRNGVAGTIWPMENVNRSSFSYSMDLDQIRHVFELIDRRNEELIGIYHSHPTDGAYPSEGDIALNNYPEVAHLIISFANSTPELKCFKLTGKKAFPIQLKFIN